MCVCVCVCLGVSGWKCVCETFSCCKVYVFSLVIVGKKRRGKLHCIFIINTWVSLDANPPQYTIYFECKCPTKLRLKKRSESVSILLIFTKGSSLPLLLSPFPSTTTAFATPATSPPKLVRFISRSYGAF